MTKISDSRKNNKITILIPVFNDWNSLSLLLPAIQNVLDQTELDPVLLIINDASTQTPRLSAECLDLQLVKNGKILNLLRNLGHQRAIAVGLVYAQEHYQDRDVVIMDGDGEDTPDSIPDMISLCRRCENKKVVFAARVRRSESFIFKAFYCFYRMIHYLLTGIATRVGNFSVIPAACLKRLVVCSELWSHYVACVFRSRIPNTTIPTSRGKRLDGKTQMSFVLLIIHGLSAIAVFSDIVIVRLVIINIFFTLLLLGAIVLLPWVLPESMWSVYNISDIAIGVFLIFLLHIVISGFVVIIVFSARQKATFIPIRDCQYFIGDVVPCIEVAEGKNNSAQ